MNMPKIRVLSPSVFKPKYQSERSVLGAIVACKSYLPQAIVYSSSKPFSMFLIVFHALLCSMKRKRPIQAIYGGCSAPSLKLVWWRSEQFDFLLILVKTGHSY